MAGAAGKSVKLKAFDVDDPTPADWDASPPVIDTNDTNGPTGNDNNTGSSLFSGTFSTSTTNTITTTLDGNGEATVEFITTQKPGANYRIAAVLNESASLLDALQVTDATGARYVAPDAKPVQGFAGVTSPMLTIWRKLHIEVDVMKKPVGSRGSPDQVTATGLSLSPFSPTRPYATLSLNADLPEEGTGDPANYSGEFYAGGTAKISGREEGIHANGESSLVFKMPPPPYTPINDPDYANSAQVFFQPFISGGIDVCDDDGVGLGFDLLPVSNPISDQVKTRFLPAFIAIEAVSNDLNPQREIPFDLYSAQNGTLITGGSSLNDFQDMEGADSPYYWYWFVGVGYQGFETFPIPLKNVDGEPDDEDIVAGATIGGFTKIFVAAVDEYDTVRTATDKAVAFSKTFSDVLAHEIGHGPNSEGNDDHLEGGLMSAGDAAIDRDFSGPTLIRLRGSLKWSE